MDGLVNIESEQAVLGSILYEPELIQECRMSPEHFGRVSHVQIFRAMRELDQAGKVVDMVTVVTELGSAIEQVGGVTYLSQLTDAVASTENFEMYEKMVLESYRLRRARELAASLVNSPTEEKIVEVYNDLSELQEVGINKQRSKNDVLFEIYEDINTPKGDITGINTGLKDLNDMTGGWQNGDLIILAARPSMGKTAFALGKSVHNAHRKGVTDIFSLEMGDKSLTHRMLSSIGRIDGSKWRNPNKSFTERDHESFSHAVSQYSKYHINIHDEPGQTVFDIKAKVRRSMKEHPDKPHLVVIDYLQLITIAGKHDRHDLAIGSVTRELKNMARSFNIPVILLSQLSRGVEQRQDKRPMMSDLRDSGSIEQDADVIIFLYRDEYYNKNSDAKGIVEIIIAKQRNGPVGTVDALFVKEYGQFLDLDRQMEVSI
ncbi:replicative DNA helicase [Fictibacillus macauensis ZFHKF-1]|uniref:Replicative DNA helicase n=1 Tax=Fictibacillus macauensis ZFHKF-1 TaxID=1196324 RepID=I8UGJ1_9BACL|nr:replicative DNA helicase [Fictibacillus macauensis]EIT85943.1 replicative DNA helicase [Fictibacillus macauensis ZFHKF-1]